ncbi:SDR family NAD(P)-dependent oxidoreductase (plasmid) [Dermatophilaceae bacterium Soc4.6]
MSSNRAVLLSIRAAGEGRVITVSSVGGLVGQPFADAYCEAKFAVEGLMQSLAPVIARYGVNVSIVEPAAVSSAFVANTGVLDFDLNGQDGSGDQHHLHRTLQAAYLRRSAA